MVKPVRWQGTALRDIRAFPNVVRQQSGYELYRVQQGQQPRNWRSMSVVGPGVVEIRIQGERAHRVFYVAKFPEAVYVLHAFEKKTRATATFDLDIGKARYRSLVRDRAARPKEG